MRLANTFVAVFVWTWHCALVTTVLLTSQALGSPCTGGTITALDRDSIATTLASPQGLAGTLHGRPPDSRGSTAVLSVRLPEDFFSAKQLSLIPVNEGAQDSLNQAKRNDAICVRGELGAFGADQIHILVSEVTRLEAPPDRYPDLAPYTYVGPTPGTLPDSGSLVARVHAAEPNLLVVEVIDRIMPVYVPAGAELASPPWRFDKVTLKYRKQNLPDGITHLELDAGSLGGSDTQADERLIITDSLRARHNQAVQVTGTLALFPASSLISRDTFAVSVTDSEGFETTFTVVNLEDGDVFEKLQRTLASAWNKHQQGRIRGRNHFLNPSIRVSVAGTLNVVSPSQANPQIVVERPADVVIMGHSSTSISPLLLP